MLGQPRQINEQMAKSHNHSKENKERKHEPTEEKFNVHETYEG